MAKSFFIILFCILCGAQIGCTRLQRSDDLVEERIKEAALLEYLSSARGSKSQVVVSGVSAGSLKSVRAAFPSIELRRMQSPISLRPVLGLSVAIVPKTREQLLSDSRRYKFEPALEMGQVAMFVYENGTLKETIDLFLGCRNGEWGVLASRPGGMP